MAIPAFLVRPSAYAAQSTLMMHGEPDRVCPSSLKVMPAVLGKCAVFAYTWSFEGEPHEGLLLIGEQKGAAFASFVDSFHTGSANMPMTGGFSEGKVTLKGSYAAPPGPNWGWRIEIADAGGALRLGMINISPEGVDDPAVEALYQPA